MVINFFAPYQASADEGAQWVFDRRRIVSHYLRTWFIIDLLSVLPFDVIGVASDSETLSRFRAIRIIRLFRLLKLFRVLRAIRIVKRWETSVGVNYKIMSLIKFIILMLLTAHWMGCCWTIAGGYETDPDVRATLTPDPDDLGQFEFSSWMDKLGLAQASPSDVYAAALYWYAYACFWVF